MLQKISLIISVFCLSFLSFSCNEKEEKEDLVNAVSKNAAIETEVSVQHDASADILVTKHKVWVKNHLVKEMIKKDTIPALGDTLQTVKDQNGNEVQQSAKKDYEFYITVQ